jgi:hypothetical protein
MMGSGAANDGAAELECVVKAVSLPRPWPSAIIDGPCRAIGGTWRLELGEEDLLLVIHASSEWDADVVPEMRLLWPELELDEAKHPTGLVGATRLIFVERALSLTESLAGPWSGGPWSLLLDEQTLGFEPAIECPGYHGLFEIPDATAARIARAWERRPR